MVNVETIQDSVIASRFLRPSVAGVANKWHDAPDEEYVEQH